MAGIIAKQPNSLYCRISTVVDAPTNWNMTKQDYIDLRDEKAKQDIKIRAGTWKAGTTVYKSLRCDSFISRSSNYCVKCGQALDWSDDE